MRYAARVDGNQAEIVAGLRACGCSVETNSARIGGGFPDLVVGYGGNTYLFEVKQPGGKLNKLQRKWHGLWRGQVAVVRTVDDALRVVGLL